MSWGEGSARGAVLSVLEDLRRLTPELEGVLVMAPDGEIVAMSAVEEVAEIMAPILATLTTLSDRACQETGRGPMDQLILRGPRGVLMVQDLGAGWILGAIAGSEAPLGLLMEDLVSTQARIEPSLPR